MRLRLDCAYDGTDFCGWARQPDQRSVQSELEQAIATVLRVPPVRVVCAGRTDAGVHARAQVVHVDVPEDAWAAVSAVALRRLNGILPADLAVFAIAAAPEGFDARFSVLRRHYEYRLSDYVIDPVMRRFVVHHPEPLDLKRMVSASSRLLGERDFAAFCRQRDGASSVRTLERFEWSRDEAGIITAHLSADAFCHSMVRSLVGAMLPVGDGRREVDWPVGLLDEGTRSSAVPVAPPHGLVLSRVDYAPDDQLAAQAEAARRWRGEPELNPMLRESPMLREDPVPGEST